MKEKIKSPLKVVLYFGLLLQSFLFFDNSFGQSLDLKFDYSQAELTLEYLEKGNLPTDKMELLLKSNGTSALLKKLGKEGTDFEEVLKSAIEDEDNPEYRSFQMRTVKKNIDQLKEFVHTVKMNESDIQNDISKGLLEYVEGHEFESTVYFLMGGSSAGFTFGGGTSDFFIGMHHYKNDLGSIRITTKHELFHVLQFKNYDPGPVGEKLIKESFGLAVAHAILFNLFMEGTAEYVADYKNLNLTDSPHLKELYDQGKVNEYRINEVFYLLDRLLVDAVAHPESVEYGKIYSILFEWNWNNPAYYAGYKITQKLVDFYGEDVLQKYLKKDALYFVKDYIELQEKGVEGIYKFSEEFQSMINQLLEKIEGL